MGVMMHFEKDAMKYVKNEIICMQMWMQCCIDDECQKWNNVYVNAMLYR